MLCIGPDAKKGAPPIKELLPKDSEDLPKGTSLRNGGEGWRARKFLRERRGRSSFHQGAPFIKELLPLKSSFHQGAPFIKELLPSRNFLKELP